MNLLLYLVNLFSIFILKQVLSVYLNYSLSAQIEDFGNGSGSGVINQ